MKIYTRTGDKGITSLGSGDRVSKSDARLEAYGSLDELNCFLGELVLRLAEKSGVAHLPRLESEVMRIQNDLFTLGAHLACPSEEQRQNLPRLPLSRVSNLEHEIDWMSAQLPPLKEFILPSGTSICVQYHICRTVTRRAERRCVALGNTVEASIVEYLNRLSDYLFVCARLSSHLEGVQELPWKKP